MRVLYSTAKLHMPTRRRGGIYRRSPQHLWRATPHFGLDLMVLLAPRRTSFNAEPSQTIFRQDLVTWPIITIGMNGTRLRRSSSLPSLRQLATRCIFSVWVGDSDGTQDVSGGYGWFYVANNTDSTSYLASYAKPSGITFSGSSAEWIMERPSVDCPSCVPLPLADFGTASITGPEASDSDYGYHDPSTDFTLLYDMEFTTSPYTVLATSSIDDDLDINFLFHHSD